jgi:exonuclease III/ribonuclease HI
MSLNSSSSASSSVFPTYPIPHRPDWDPTWFDSIRLATFNMRSTLTLSSLSSIASWASSNQIDIVCLQETRLFGALHNAAKTLGFTLYSSPGAHKGVAMLVSTDLSPFVTSHSAILPGRALRVKMVVEKCSFCFVSVYARSGTDHSGNESDVVTENVELLKLVVKECSNASVAVVAGDLNETVDPRDRLSFSPHQDRAIAALSRSYCDSFRCLHPEQAFTYFPSATDRSPSRLDYIWTRGGVVMDSAIALPPTPSDHRPVVSTVSLGHVFRRRGKVTWSNPLPRVDGASERSVAAFKKAVGPILSSSDFDLWLQEGDRDTVEKMASELILSIRHVAARKLGTFGHRQGKRLFKDMRVVRRDIARVRKLLQKSSIPPWSASPTQDFVVSLRASLPPVVERAQWTRVLGTALRDLRREERRLSKSIIPARVLYEQNPGAAGKILIQKDQNSSLDAIYNPLSHSLVMEETEIKSTLLNHFGDVFGSNMVLAAPTEYPPFYDDVQPPPSTESRALLASLERPFSADEVRGVLQRASYRTAAGPDGVSTGLWKLLVFRGVSNAVDRWDIPSLVLRFLTQLANAFLRLGTVPGVLNECFLKLLWKSSDHQHLVTNLRPISLQNSVAKLPSSLLVQRLNPLVSSARLLKPAHESFVIGGNALANVASLVDCIEDAKSHGKPLYCFMFDIAKCYDSIPFWAVERALISKGIPQRVVSLVVGMLKGSSTRILTSWGPTVPLSLRRGLRQGDPLSPLLCNLVTDLLHAGLECNPLFGGCNDGYALVGRDVVLVISSKGFADDIFVLSGSWEGIQRMADWTSVCLDSLYLKAHLGKTRFFGLLASGELTSAQLLLQGVSVAPILSFSLPFKALGLWLTLGLDWTAELNHIQSLINWIAGIPARNQLTFLQGVHFIKHRLLPMLEYRFRCVPVHFSTLEQWDSLICRLLHPLAPSTRRPHKRELVASISGLVLPSALYVEASSTELLFSLCAPTDRPGVSLGARIRFADCHRRSDVDGSNSRVGLISSTLKHFGVALVKSPVVRASVSPRVLPVIHLSGWRMRAWQRVDGLLDCVGSPPSSPALELVSGSVQPGPFDIVAYTDGSRDPQTGMSVAAFVLDHDGFDHLLFTSTVPPAQCQANLSGLVLNSFFTTRLLSPSIMVVELLAIVEALRAIPVCISAIIYTDSKSAIDAFAGFDPLTVTRRHLRCPVRAILRWLASIVRVRRSYHASTHFLHVKAHTDEDDRVSCGNRAVDTLARCALKMSLPSAMCGSMWVPNMHLADLPYQMWVLSPPAGLNLAVAGSVSNSVPWSPCAVALVSQVKRVHVYGDPRVAARHLMQARFTSECQKSGSQGAFARASDHSMALMQKAFLAEWAPSSFLLALFTQTLALKQTVREHSFGDSSPSVLCPACESDVEDLEHLTLCASVRAKVSPSSSSFDERVQRIFRSPSLSVYQKLGFWHERDVGQALAVGLSELDVSSFKHARVAIAYTHACWLARCKIAGAPPYSCL